MLIAAASAHTIDQSPAELATQVAVAGPPCWNRSGFSSHFINRSAVNDFHLWAADICVVHPSPQIKRAHPFECARCVAITAAVEPTEGSRPELPVLLPAASRAGWRRAAAVLLRERVALPGLAVAVRTAEPGLAVAGPTVAVRRAVAMRVQPGQGPQQAAQTAGPAVLLRERLPTVRQQEQRHQQDHRLVR